MDAREALSRWVDDGLLDADLADRLGEALERYQRPERANRLIQLLAFVGVVLIGGGLLLFISSQWDESAPARRLVLLLIVYLLVVGAAALSAQQRLHTTARGLWFLSSIVAGVNIFLIGQVFNLPLNYWQGTALWMVSALAMGWAAPSAAQGWLVIPLGVLTLGWISTPSSQFFDQGAFLVDQGGIRPLLPLIGLALVAGERLVAGTGFAWLARPAQVIGVVLIAVPLTVSTFHPTVFAYLFQIDARLFHIVVVIVALAVIAVAWAQRPHPLVAWALAGVGILLVALLPQRTNSDGAIDDLDFDDSIPWLAEAFDGSELLFGLYTALIFGLALATVAAGQRFAIAALVNVGIATIAVLGIALYVGRIAGSLPTSIAVLLGGVLLVGGAVLLERTRRDLTSEVSP